MAKDAANDYILLTGRANPELALAIGRILKKEIDEPISSFPDGEIRVRITHNMRRRPVFIIQPTSPPVNDHILELILMIDAAKRASASEVILVIPYFGYSRQDRKEMPRVPISASAIASLYEQAGANRILTIDIHSEQEEGFIRGSWDNLYGSYSLLPAIKARKLRNLVVASPDKGGVIRAAGYARLLKASDIAIVYKERDLDVNTKTEELAMIGDVLGKDVFLVDDMVTTAGTLVGAANFIKKKGARSVRATATHGLFVQDALPRIEKSAIEEVIVTDTVAPSEAVKRNKKITVVSVAPLLAEAIKRIHSGESISKDLILKPS